MAEASGRRRALHAARHGRGMSAPASRTVPVNGQPCQVSEKGAGARVFWLPSAPMALHWGPFAEALAVGHRVIARALPGFFGSRGHDELDDHLAGCLAVRDLLEAAGFQAGDTLLGSSTVGGAGRRCGGDLAGLGRAADPDGAPRAM